MSQRKSLALASCLFFSTILAVAVPPGAAQAPANVPDRLQWFRDAKFGMFIHWGVYSIARP